MTETVRPEDLRDGGKVILDNVRVQFFVGPPRYAILASEDSTVWARCDSPAFAQATIRRVPREFKVGSVVTWGRYTLLQTQPGAVA